MLMCDTYLRPRLKIGTFDKRALTCKRAHCEYLRPCQVRNAQFESSMVGEESRLVVLSTFNASDQGNSGYTLSAGL